MTFIFISFIAGVLTVLAPCILPLLPVIVGHSLTDATLSKRRLFTVVISLGSSIVIFTLLLKASTLLINVPQDYWRYISGGIIFVFGFITLFPKLWESISLVGVLNLKSNQALSLGYQKNNIWGDIIVGVALGPIFSACSPTYFVILATVLPASFFLGLIYLIVYSAGLSFALLVIAFIGQKIINRLGIVSDTHGWFKRTIGALFILVSLLILTGYDKKFQIFILDKGFFDVTKVEQSILDGNNNPNILDLKSNSGETKQSFLSPEVKAKLYPLAPDLSSIDAYINTPVDTSGKDTPINLVQFKGKKVVLLDIWTYSCINCQRTLPYLNDWYKKYEDEGLVIIGLHTPEFAFEGVESNVRDAVKKFGIKYPVVMDNDFSTWNAYQNRYWPRKYLIDMDGYIVYDHAGEGEYDITEQKIQDALSELHTRLNMKNEINKSISDPSNKILVDAKKINSPEVYFGSGRNTYLANGIPGTEGEQTLALPKIFNLNELYLSGTWDFTPEYAEANYSSEIFFKYSAKNVYMVASAPSLAEIEVYIDGKISSTQKIKEERLYNIINGDDYGVHTLKIRIKSGTLRAFTFTFG